MPEFLSDPFFLIVIGLAAALLIGPPAWSLVAGLFKSKQRDILSLIDDLKEVRDYVSEEHAESINAICRDLFEETLEP
jgi:hypothetical protein